MQCKSPLYYIMVRRYLHTQKEKEKRIKEKGGVYYCYVFWDSWRDVGDGANSIQWQQYKCLLFWKVVWHEIFNFKFFRNQSPPGQWESLCTSNLYENSLRYSKVKGIDGVKDTSSNLSPVSWISVTNTKLRISLSIFVKIRDGSVGP